MTIDGKDYPEFPVPPNWVFKYDRSRTAPEKQIMEQEQTMFVGEGTKFPSLHFWDDKRLETIGIKRDGEDLVMIGTGEKMPRATEEEREMGGMLRLFKGVKHPAKGFPFPPAFYGINGAKRITLNMAKMAASKDMVLPIVGFLITPKKYKLRILARAMKLYNSSMMMFIEPFVLEEEFCKPFTNELRKFINNFFTTYGLPFFGVDLAAECFVMDFEYDDAYCLRVEDGMSMTTKERMMADPVKELTLVFRTMSLRDRWDEGEPKMNEKFEAFLKVIKYAFWVPGVKRCFLKALAKCDFKNFQLDEGDREHTLLWPDYQFQGKTQKERWEMFQELYKDGLPPRLVWRKRSDQEIASLEEARLTRNISQDKVLFLDIDGVLNCANEEGMIRPELAARFHRIVKETNCGVVLSSTWRGHPEWERILRDLGVQTANFVGITPYLGKQGEHPRLSFRANEIKAWLETHPIRNYVILDDDNDFLDDQTLIRVDSSVGLSEKDADMAISILNSVAV